MPLTVRPPLPIIKPIFELSTTSVFAQGPVDQPPFAFRVLIISERSLFARSIPSGVPVMAIRLVSTASGVLRGSASLATCTRTPKSRFKRFIFSPPLPITNPTIPLGTRASYVFSPGRGADGMTRQLSPDADATTRAPSRRASCVPAVSPLTIASICRCFTSRLFSAFVNMAWYSFSRKATASCGPVTLTCIGRSSSGEGSGSNAPPLCIPLPRTTILQRYFSCICFKEDPFGPNTNPM
mmetsp:Transcript_13664/g.36337  ORF Transcript_13664/g.36337 Transcript_13664/m.36337 type:complete len:239 (-) Transcript_13664:595-1311(-)